MWIMAQNTIKYNTEGSDDWVRNIFAVYDTKEEAVQDFWKSVIGWYCTGLSNCYTWWSAFNFYERRAKHRIVYDEENDILYGGLTDGKSIVFICEIESGEPIYDETFWGLDLWPSEYDWRIYDMPVNKDEWRKYLLHEYLMVD